MASWTDRIPTFNPYVEQQPIDTMLKVGVYKQQKYEEGVKRIQTNIDNVAGLDIANPVQQKYLESKLNSLGNNLTFLAAGDFSDFSLRSGLARTSAARPLLTYLRSCDARTGID